MKYLDRLIFSVTVFGLLTALLWAGTDVAFWKEYSSQKNDENVYLYLPLNDPDGKDAEGTVSSIERVGQVSYESEGKFNRCLKLSGNGGLKCQPGNIFPGGFLAIEAWVKLDSLPEKEAAIVFRPAEVDKSAYYDPNVDVTKGFALLVDSKGALHLETTNCFYGNKTRTSSQPGVIQPGQWVHVAGVSAVFPISFRRLYVNGNEVCAQPIAWGQGLVVSGEEEKKPGVIYIGNNDKGTAGLAGCIDQVRIHRNIFKFWPKEDTSWCQALAGQKIVDGPPYFLKEHQPVVSVFLDGSPEVQSSLDKVAVKTGEGSYVEGVRKQGFSGKISISAPQLLPAKEGTIEFWMQPVGFNNHSDRNVGIITQPFVLYIFNGGSPPRPLSLYFPKADGGLHFVNDTLETDYYPGAWYHVVITWKEKNISLYINGKKAGCTLTEGFQTAFGKEYAENLAFNGYGTNAIIDEIRIYHKDLLPEEAVNAWARYRDVSQLVKEVKALSVVVMGEYLPSQNCFFLRLVPELPAENIKEIRVNLVDSNSKVIRSAKFQPGKPEYLLETGNLADGDYKLVSAVITTEGKELAGGSLSFVRKHFAWENNNLGITEEVYPPFQPLKVTGKRVYVVSRSYQFNSFGLLEEVVTLGRNILSSPVVIRYETSSGEGIWKNQQGSWKITKPDRATFLASGRTDFLEYITESTVEVDGCIKVDLTLKPGQKKEEVKSMWMEIPLKSSEVPLMHTIGDGLRSNYSGPTPQGTGVVWDGSNVSRSSAWRNLFVPYIWLGAEERGLAFFAENDKGWVTEKNKSKKPVVKLVREGSQITLQIYLINRPVILTEERKIVFGLQASPTKPMPENWRTKIQDMPGGLAVVPWGGLQCPSQGPFRDDWTIVDKILEARQGKPFDNQWLKEYAEKNKPPLVHGTWDWVNSVQHFAGRASAVGMNKPLAVYQEEMAASTVRPEWYVFQDEWKLDNGPQQRSFKSINELGQGQSVLGGGAGISFVRSYADFGTWMANEWLKRGVSLYWDNTYCKLATNTRTTAAYVGEDGFIQPCLIIWNQREYQKRVWHLLQEWRKKRPEPLEWTIHMTNTLMLPVHTWATVNLDHELGNNKPFSPEWLRTETIGRQVGNYPLSLYPVSGRGNKAIENLPKQQQERIEWGMRAVHEIQRAGTLEKILADFGYGQPEVIVHNYWEEKPVVEVTPDQVKWLALVKPAQRKVLLVLSSWSEEKQIWPELTFFSEHLGFPLKNFQLIDAEQNIPLAVLSRTGDPSISQQVRFKVDLAGPWGVRILRLESE